MNPEFDRIGGHVVSFCWNADDENITIAAD
jgi:hypothetical protein